MFVSLRRRGEVPVRASRPQWSPGDAPQPTIELVLPLEYTAFCLLHQDRYLHYTRERVQDAWMSRQVVEAVLGNLATIWPTVISSPRPAAVAWRLLDALITSALGGRQAGAAQPADAVHQLLPRAQADAVILRCRLDLSEKEAAELMGVEAPAVASQLRMAQRALPGRWTAAPAGAQP
ncbi:sigma-70 region 4 domain-containing protein [Streptomyces sp. NBC_01478]|uniref:sigma-70 region 4 domain-containing protein n=1 Tax=Streptomyces sp. NBC_01478 TaxID=2903882 RepID=UPI002E35A001|nr:sigma-70 region 4 domain-containing protein [Streptomyces sp. NBC_01478]